jgi:hypothetical protein
MMEVQIWFVGHSTYLFLHIWYIFSHVKLPKLFIHYLNDTYLRRLANVSPFFNSLSDRLRITKYCLRSVSLSLRKITRFIQGNNIAWTNLDMFRKLQHSSFWHIYSFLNYYLLKYMYVLMTCRVSHTKQINFDISVSVGKHLTALQKHVKTLSHNVVSSTPRHERDLNSQF